MNRALCIAAALVVAIGCKNDEGTSVDPDAIDRAQLATVQRALNVALATNPTYPTLSTLVFPFIDRASRLPHAGGDTTYLVGIELDIQATQGGMPVDAQFTAILGWRGFDAATSTVDTVFLVLGAGRAPITDALAGSFSPEMPGSGTAIVAHQDPDSTVTAWQTGTGTLMTSTSSYGATTTQSGGGLTLGVARGTLFGRFEVTAADEITGGGAPTIATARDFTGGARALRVEIRGTL